MFGTLVFANVFVHHKLAQLTKNGTQIFVDVSAPQQQLALLVRHWTQLNACVFAPLSRLVQLTKNGMQLNANVSVQLQQLALLVRH